MNTIPNSSVHVAMDGQTLYSSAITQKISASRQTVNVPITPNGSQVAQNIEQNLAEIKADSQQLQKMS